MNRWEQMYQEDERVLTASFAGASPFRIRSTEPGQSRGEFGAKSAEARRFMGNHAAAGLVDRVTDRLHVERRDRADVDDLAIHAGFLGRRLRDVHQRAVGDYRQLTALAHHIGLAERHRVVAFRNFALGVRCPGLGGFFGIAVEGAVVYAFGLEKNDRVVRLDRADQQALCVVGV